MSAAVGEPAPAFELPGTDGTDEGRRTYSLAEFAGKPVVLVFYPGDDTPVCTRQLNAYTRDIDAFDDVGAQVLAVSPQSVESHDELLVQAGRLRLPAPRRRGQGGGRGVGRRSVRSASTGARRSSSTPTASSATPTGPWPGSRSGATDELVAAVKSGELAPSGREPATDAGQQAAVERVDRAQHDRGRPSASSARSGRATITLSSRLDRASGRRSPRSGSAHWSSANSATAVVAGVRALAGGAGWCDHGVDLGLVRLGAGDLVVPRRRALLAEVRNGRVGPAVADGEPGDRGRASGRW